MQTTGAKLIEETEIIGLTCDSRKVEPGFLFAALPGAKADGRAFVQDAIAKGASAVLAPPGGLPGDIRVDVPVLTDDNPRRRYALMAALFFTRQPATVCAVTGTNGKTSVANFLRQIWAAQDLAAASLGTLGLTAPGRIEGGSLTTPDPVDMHRTLSELAESGVDHLAIEASSHGLEQYRLDGVRLAAAGFTNLTRDHLDYHRTMEAYLAAKLRLFSDLLVPGASAVVNADGEYAEQVMAAASQHRLRLITVGRGGADIQLETLDPLPDGQRLDLVVFGSRESVTLPLVGDFQVENVLVALGLALATGADQRRAVAALEALEGVAGRLQLVGQHPKGAGIYVDYAHTPDALSACLKALRPHTLGRLIVIVGCGGDRDAGKRPEMGRIAADLADQVIITDDNPRSEDPATIRAAMLSAAPNAEEIADRAEAIRSAVSRLADGDVLVVAGKGHERGQIIGDTVRPFDDAEEVQKALEGVGL